MQRYKIIHRTYYNFTAPVELEPHTLLLRPREGAELHIESSALHIKPTCQLRWYRDVQDNAVAIASFDTLTTQLSIESEVVIQQFNEDPLNFLVSEYAQHFPFQYLAEDKDLLLPYLTVTDTLPDPTFSDWIKGFWQAQETIETYSLLLRLCHNIKNKLRYQSREEPGVQSVSETLSLGSGSCRDFANLFMQTARFLGLASRFVSGYLHTEPSSTDYGATHAWAEVFIPGAGWKGFDPTIGDIVGSEHITVAVARRPDAIPPVAGSYLGTPGSSMDVGVWISEED